MTVNLVSKKLVYKKLECDMHPAHLALYAFFVMQKKKCVLETETCRTCTDCFTDTQGIFSSQNQITDLYRRMCGTRPLNEMSDTGITGLDGDNFNSYKSKIKEKFQKSFGLYAVKELEIASVGTRPNTCYGILMDKTKIEVIY